MAYAWHRMAWHTPRSPRSILVNHSRGPKRPAQVACPPKVLACPPARRLRRCARRLQDALGLIGAPCPSCARKHNAMLVLVGTSVRMRSREQRRRDHGARACSVRRTPAARSRHQRHVSHGSTHDTLPPSAGHLPEAGHHQLRHAGPRHGHGKWPPLHSLPSDRVSGAAPCHARGRTLHSMHSCPWHVCTWRVPLLSTVARRRAEARRGDPSAQACALCRLSS